MVRIRLFRTGTTKRPTYRIVVMDGRRKRQGRVLEQVGTYDPRGGGGVSVDEDAVERWLDRGAQMSDTVRSLVRRHRKQSPTSEEAPGDTPEQVAPPEAGVAPDPASQPGAESSGSAPAAT